MTHRSSPCLIIDGFHPVCPRRLAAVCDSVPDGSELMANNVVQLQCPSLPHFIALLCRPSASSIPPGTSLIVVDSLSALLNHAFPRTPESRIGNIGTPSGPCSSLWDLSSLARWQLHLLLQEGNK